jgi:hypothetical protein
MRESIIRSSFVKDRDQCVSVHDWMWCWRKSNTYSISLLRHLPRMDSLTFHFSEFCVGLGAANVEWLPNCETSESLSAREQITEVMVKHEDRYTHPRSSIEIFWIKEHPVVGGSHLLKRWLGELVVSSNLFTSQKNYLTITDFSSLRISPLNAISDPSGVIFGWLSISGTTMTWNIVSPNCGMSRGSQPSSQIVIAELISGLPAFICLKVDCS